MTQTLRLLLTALVVFFAAGTVSIFSPMFPKQWYETVANYVAGTALAFMLAILLKVIWS